MAHEVETMFSARVTPWHGLGNVLENIVSSEDAIKAAGLDWTVDLQSIVLESTGVAIPGHRAVVRSSDNSVLGMVKGRYMVVQNSEAFAFTDALLGQGIKYETAGSLKSGRRVWICAKMSDSIKVARDIIEQYMVFTNSHDGTSGVKVALTPVRVVCNNTLTMALDGAIRTWSARHTKSIQEQMKEAEISLELASEYHQGFAVEAEKMVNINLYRDEVVKFLEQLFPLPDGAGKRTANNASTMAAMIEEQHNASDLIGIQNTAWGWYNAVSDVVTHAIPLRQTDNYQENRFMRVVDGHPIIERAQKLLQQIHS